VRLTDRNDLAVQLSRRGQRAGDRAELEDVAMQEFEPGLGLVGSTRSV
jgi:hypothetical protein